MFFKRIKTLPFLFLFAYMSFQLFVCVKSFRKKRSLKLSWWPHLHYYWVKSYFCYPSKKNYSKQLKTHFGETPWLTGHHATPLVTCFLLSPCYLQDAMPCQWSSSDFTASATDFRECLLLSGIFYLTLLSASFKASLGLAVQP